jgi:hypothetical protein
MTSSYDYCKGQDAERDAEKATPVPVTSNPTTPAQDALEALEMVKGYFWEPTPDDGKVWSEADVIDFVEAAIRRLRSPDETRGERALVANDVRIYGIGITVHTPEGVKRVPPRDVIFKNQPVKLDPRRIDLYPSEPEPGPFAGLSEKPSASHVHRWVLPEAPVTASNYFCGDCGFFPGPAVKTSRDAEPQRPGEIDARFVDRLARAGCTCPVLEVYEGEHRAGCPALTRGEKP